MPPIARRRAAGLATPGRGRREGWDAGRRLVTIRSQWCDRPRRRRAEQRDELAARDHSITSSAIASSLSGISRRKAFAVLRLITSSNLVGYTTGKSAGFSPLRILLGYSGLAIRVDKAGSIADQTASCREYVLFV